MAELPRRLMFRPTDGAQASLITAAAPAGTVMAEAA